MKQTFEFTSFGEMTIKGYCNSKTTEPKKTIVIVHGMAETIDRYDAFADFLINNNYAVITFDQRGHGRTAEEIEKLGHIGIDGWHRMKYDLKKVIELARSTYDAPIIIMGHSMGSYIVRDFILDYGYYIDGIILSGTGYQSPLVLKIGYWLASVIANIKGDNYRSEMIYHLAVGANNNKFKDNRTNFDWLSRDKERVDNFVNDPMCGATHPVGFFKELSDNVYRILYKDYFKHNKTNLPMLIFSGMSDPVGSFFKGVKKSAAYYRKAGFIVTLKGYPDGRHEMLNETNRNEVYNDIMIWLDNN